MRTNYDSVASSLEITSISDLVITPTSDPTLTWTDVSGSAMAWPTTSSWADTTTGTTTSSRTGTIPPSWTTTTTSTRRSYTVAPDTEEDEESYCVFADKFEDDEELSPKHKKTFGVKEIGFGLVTVPRKKLGGKEAFSVNFYSPKKRLKDCNNLPSRNYFFHNGIAWKKVYCVYMGESDFYKFIETTFNF